MNSKLFSLSLSYANQRMKITKNYQNYYLSPLQVGLTSINIVKRKIIKRSLIIEQSPTRLVIDLVEVSPPSFLRAKLKGLASEGREAVSHSVLTSLPDPAISLKMGEN